MSELPTVIVDISALYDDWHMPTYSAQDELNRIKQVTESHYVFGQSAHEVDPNSKMMLQDYSGNFEASYCEESLSQMMKNCTNKSNTYFICSAVTRLIEMKEKHAVRTIWFY